MRLKLSVALFLVIAGVLVLRPSNDAERTTRNVGTRREEPRHGTSVTGTRSARIGPVLGAPVPAAHPDPTSSMVVPDVFRSTFPPGVPVPDYGVTPGIYPGSVSIDDLYNKYFGLVQWSAENIFPQYNARALDCRNEFHGRGGVIDGTAKWDVALRIVGNGSQIRIVDVLVDPSFWPPSFDGELKACLVDALLQSSAQSSVRLDMTVDANLCFSAR